MGMRRWPGEGWEGRGSGAGRMEVRELLERMLHCPLGGLAHADSGIKPTA